MLPWLLHVFFSFRCLFLFSVKPLKPLITEITKNKTTPKICIITVPLFFLSARQLSHTWHHDKSTTGKKKRKEPRLKQREKLRCKGKSSTKLNSCNPKVTMTDQKSEEGWEGQFGTRETLQSSSSWRERLSAAVETILFVLPHAFLQLSILNEACMQVVVYVRVCK